MTREEVIETLVPVFQQYPIKRVAFFGSYARGDQSDKSDVDLVVDFTESAALFENFYDLYDAVEQRLGFSVVLLRYGAVVRDMKPIIKHKVLGELRWFYEAYQKADFRPVLVK